MTDTTEGAQLRQLAEVLGEPLRVIAQAPLFDARVEAKVFGYAPGQYVALHSPGSKPNSGLSSLAPRLGDELIVRFLVDGIAFGFTSRVMHVTAHPGSLVFLEYPESVAQVSVRQDRRIPCRLPCNLVLSSGERSPALLLDISEGGGRIASRSLIPEDRASGTPVSVELTLPPPDGGTHTIDGEVVRTENARQTVIAGIRFKQRHRDLTHRLAAFLCLDELSPAEPEASGLEAAIAEN